MTIILKLILGLVSTSLIVPFVIEHVEMFNKIVDTLNTISGV